jgi:dTDP-4-dehydrorhamnose reductase
MRILILGASGMLGHSLFTNLPKYGHDVYGTIRLDKHNDFSRYKEKIFSNIDLTDSKLSQIKNIIQKIKPDYVINCIGIIKQKNISKDESTKELIYINSYLPKIIKGITEACNVKLIHFSTDCVFDGSKGNYSEESISDAKDMYGISKHNGELSAQSSLTLRTSIIGHELNSSVSLLEWFLSKDGEAVEGYSNAIFSGLPTVYVAEVLDKFIFGSNLSGIYHLSVDPIDKYTLLSIIAKTYQKDIKLINNTDFKINRSLSSKKLSRNTGYNYLNWDDLITLMHKDRLNNKIYENKKN